MVTIDVQHITKFPTTEELVLQIIDWESKPLLARRVQDGKVYEYRLGDDHFVYQIIDGTCNGWLTSHAAWVNTLHRAFTDEELLEGTN